MAAVELDFRQLAQQLPVAVYACDTQGRIMFHNAAAAELWAREPVADRDRWSGAWRIHDAQSRVLPVGEYPTCVATRQGGAIPERNLIIERPDGSRRNVVSTPRALLAPDGAVIGAIDVLLDVTGPKPDDAAPLQGEQLLRRALDASHLALWDFDLRSGRVELSQAWSEMMGGEPAPTSTDFAALAALVPEADQQRISAAMRPALEGASRTYSVEHRVRRPDGETIWVLSEGQVVERDTQGRALRAVGTNRDITQRKLTEESLRDSESRFRSLVELAADWYWEQDANFRFTLMSNSAAEDLAGLGAAEHIGRTRWELPRMEVDEDTWKRHREQLERHEVFRDFEITRRDIEGRMRSIVVSGAPVFDGSGQFTGYRGVARDITAQSTIEASMRTLEMQLRESQKMEAIGTLASGIAHDFNNIVGAILGNLALARDEVGTGHTALLRLEQINKVAVRARGLAQQILAFSRRQPHDYRAQSLRPLVEETVSMLRSMLPRTVALRTRLTDEAVDVQVDATQLQQVLMNLCTNAWHALDANSGSIEIGSAEVGLDGDALQSAANLPPGRYAHLWVRDTGRGMDAATQARIFDPFFTTKPAGQGTGLGLAVVRNIVDAHKGVIKVTSAPGQGSSFDIFLPAVDHESGLMPLDLPVETNAFDSVKNVLAVDDDEVMALMVTTLLERAGYRVTCVSDAQQALEAMRTRPDSFDLVVTDLNLAGRSGLDLARDIAQIRPDLPVVISSGFVSEAVRSQALQAGVCAVVQKENIAEELPRVLYQVLTAGSES
jgi:PAS domain S-box-containing protein